MLVYHLLDTNSSTVWFSQQYERQIYQIFEETQINIANITVLSPEVKSQLRNFSSSASTMNFSNIIQQVNCTVHSLIYIYNLEHYKYIYNIYLKMYITDIILAILLCILKYI